MRTQFFLSFDELSLQGVNTLIHALFKLFTGFLYHQIPAGNAQ